MASPPLCIYSTVLLATHSPCMQLQIHGFLDKAMHLYMAHEEDPMRIVRSGIFGGELPLIECVLKAFTIALHQTLSDGYVGRDENAWTMIHRRLPHLFSRWVGGRILTACVVQWLRKLTTMVWYLAPALSFFIVFIYIRVHRVLAVSTTTAWATTAITARHS